MFDGRLMVFPHMIDCGLVTVLMPYALHSVSVLPITCGMVWLVGLGWVG